MDSAKGKNGDSTVFVEFVKGIDEGKAKFDNFTMLEELSNITINREYVKGVFRKRNEEVKGEVKGMKDI